MNRIDLIFQRLRDQGKKGLMPFICAGDPDLDATAEIMCRAQEAGACVCEIGIPFSDPVADGPVIQSSMTWALDRLVTPQGVLEMIKRVRPKLDIGIVVMVSCSIVYRIGVEQFISQAADAGVDGLIIPDLSLEESDLAGELAAGYGLIFSQLISPTTPVERAKKIAEASTGFVYLLSRAGVTGEQAKLPADLSERVELLRAVTELPIAVGFGISSASQVSKVVGIADAAIVGSALMREVIGHRDEPVSDLAERIEGYVRGLAGGLH